MVLEEFIGHGCVQQEKSTFQTKRSKRFKGHAIYGIVTVYGCDSIWRDIETYATFDFTST